MAIAFDCPSCGKSFSVADEFAGRSGTCKGCGHTFTVPAARAALADQDDEYGIATEGYGLADAPAQRVKPQVEQEEQNVFARTYDDDFDRPPVRKSTKRSSTRKRRDSDESFLEKNGKLLIWLGIGVAILLAGVCFFAPNGKLYVGGILCVIGGLLTLAGYLIGLYVAFSEDSMYGFLSIMFPFYQTYYLVSRWDEMWPWFAMQTVGFFLVIFGGYLASQAVLEAPLDVGVRVVVPAENMLALRPWTAGGRCDVTGV